jgi:2'-5' RNA ligase
MNKRPDVLRTFVAIEIPAEVKAFLDGIASDLRKTRADVKWVRPEAMHLTLKFLGDTDKDLIPVLERDLRPIFLDFNPFEIAIAGLGAFPNLRRPRVIWAGLTEASRNLDVLAARIADKVQGHGFKKEKRGFNAHLTLGRIRSNRGQTELVDTVRQSLDMSGPGFVADHAVLFQSILKPSGAEYKPLCHFPFAEVRS